MNSLPKIEQQSIKSGKNLNIALSLSLLQRWKIFWRWCRSL